MNSLTFRVKAPFFINNAWQWMTWTTTTANKILAIDTKGRELGAARWDYGQADHVEVCQDRLERFWSAVDADFLADNGI